MASVLTITEITPVSSLIIKTDDGGTYRRNGVDDWEMLMGNSWEAAYSQEVELEKMYEAHMRALGADRLT